jgi:hypothetical protein
MTTCPTVTDVYADRTRVIAVVEPVAEPDVAGATTGVVVVRTVIVLPDAVTDVMELTSVPGISKKDGVLRKSA